MEDNRDETREEQLNNEKKRFSLSIFGIVRLAVFCFVLLFFIIITVQKSMMVSKLYDQFAVKGWTEKGKGSSQVSIFISDKLEVKDDDLGQLRFNVSSELKEAFPEDEDEKAAREKIESEESEKLGFSTQNKLLEGPYVYAFSGEGTVTIASSNDESKIITDAHAIGVGGSFFKFHPIELKTGSYFDDSELMQDGVIIDSNAAFRLFGSYDCVGKMVLIGTVPHYVRGVYDPDDGKYSVYAGSDGGYIFLPYASLVNNGLSEGINCVEFMSEDPYNGFLYNLLKDPQKIVFPEDYCEVLQNTGRFSIENLLTNVVSNWGARSMHRNHIVYPYWENIARAYENVCGIILILQMICLFIIVSGALLFLIYLYKHKTIHLKTLYDAFDNMIDKKRVKEYAKLQAVEQEKAKEKEIDKDTEKESEAAL